MSTAFVNLDTEARTRLGVLRRQLAAPPPPRGSLASRDHHPRDLARSRRPAHAVITVRDGDVVAALSMLKKKLATSGTFAEIKKRRFYLKPSERRKLKSRAARRRLRKVARRRARFEALAEK